MTSQLSLFNQPTLNVLRGVKEQMATTYKASGLSRDTVCDQMNDLADRYGVKIANGNGRKLTTATLDKWLNPSEKDHFPSIKALPIFCTVVNSVEPMRPMIEPLGWQVIGEQDARLLSWAKSFHRIKNERTNMKKLEADL